MQYDIFLCYFDVYSLYFFPDAAKCLDQCVLFNFSLNLIKVPRSFSIFILKSQDFIENWKRIMPPDIFYLHLIFRCCRLLYGGRDVCMPRCGSRAGGKGTCNTDFKMVKTGHLWRQSTQKIICAQLSF